MKRALVVVMLAACTEAPVKAPALTVDQGGATMPIDHPPIDITGGGPGGGQGGAGGGGQSQSTSNSAATRRLSIRQLANSMPIALGGSSWMIGSTSGFDTRGATLGVPDYLNVVDENLEPTSVYQKFMADAAIDACKRTSTADAALAANQRVLTRFAGLTDSLSTNRAAIDANLRYLKLRFHGVKVAQGNDAPIASLRTLFDTAVRAAAANQPVTQAHVAEGWRVVCVALLTAPEYHLY